MAPNYIKGDTKRCNGPLHKGQYLPLEEFWIHRTGRRAGKPFSQCRHCENYQKFGDTAHGLVSYSRYRFIFQELENRLGRIESLRRIGVSNNFYYRHRDNENTTVRVRTVIIAMRLLKECRAKGVVRHKRSIIYGASARGLQERSVTELSRFTNYYNGHSDIRNEYSLKSHRKRRQGRKVELTAE